ncbi:MAG: hypothetical protein QXJ06_03595, partial [Candidatus Aenigmatarchaeota archaeon]
WADEEGVGVGSWRGKGRVKVSKRENMEEKEKFIGKTWHTDAQYYNKPIVVNKEKDWILTDKIVLKLKHNKGIIISINNLEKDKNNNFYFSVSAYLGREENILNIEDRIIKIADNGKINASIDFHQYWRNEKWRDKCGQEPRTWSGNTYENILSDKQGNFYLLQQVCCPKNECVSKIRIIKLSVKLGE